MAKSFHTAAATAAIMTMAMALTGCGSDDGSAAPATGGTPAPSPAPSPAPTPVPSPTPSPTPSSPAGSPGLALEAGANGLFAGHSFFVPVSAKFNSVASASTFPDHGYDSFFAPGLSGTAQNLWENDNARTAIDAKLSTGEVELFALVIGQENEDDPPEFYRYWIDLAHSYNSQTAIFIGFPYFLYGPTLETATYDEFITQGGESIRPTLEELRQLYPDTPIIYFNYGKVLSEMKEDFEAGELEDIIGLVSPSPEQADNYLFRDGFIGHAGPMAEHICALVWAHFLYGADIETLVDPQYNREDVLRIANEVIAFNQSFQP